MLDFYIKRDNEGVVEKDRVSISHETFGSVYDAFVMLSEKTGMIVDEYSNARLYPDHVRILLKELRKHSKQASVSDLTRLFEKVVAEDALLIVRGD